MNISLAGSKEFELWTNESRNHWIISLHPFSNDKHLKHTRIKPGLRISKVIVLFQIQIYWNTQKQTKTAIKIISYTLSSSALLNVKGKTMLLPNCLLMTCNEPIKQWFQKTLKVFLFTKAVLNVLAFYKACVWTCSLLPNKLFLLICSENPSRRKLILGLNNEHSTLKFCLSNQFKLF